LSATLKLLTTILNFNPKQVLGIIAMMDIYYQQSIIDERAWQDVVFP
jgi:hypothetical protein